MMLRLLAIALAFAILPACFGANCYAQGSAPINASESADIADLKNQLEKGLKCRRPQEFAYVQAVLYKVDQGELTRQLVVETFAFARRRAKQVGRADYPFPYFQRGLEERAKKAGTPLDIDTSDLYPAANK